MENNYRELFNASHIGEFSNAWEYREVDGSLSFVVARYEPKNFRPWIFVDSKWIQEAPPEPRPLFNLCELIKRPNDPVLIVEGEKTAVAAQKQFPEYVVMTSAFGANAVKKSDWIVLADRDVTIWPDADIAGQRYANSIAHLLQSIGIKSIKIVCLPNNLTDGWDLADAIPPDLDLQGLIKARLFKVNETTALNNNPNSKPILRNMKEVKMEPINWLWPQRIACGKISVIAGDPGLGKSQFCAWLASIVTMGSTWPDAPSCKTGNIIFLSAEDDVADTIKPRLIAAGANIDNCFTLDAIKEKDKDKEKIRGFNLEKDIDHLRQAASQIDNVRMIVIDPISAYLGKIDSNNNSEIRGLLAPLADFAAEFNVAVILVTHLNKAQHQDMLARVIGSIGMVAAARCAYVVVKDKKNEKIRYFLPVKNNIGNDETGFSFEIDEKNIEENITTSCIRLNPNPIDASKILNAEAESGSATNGAKEFLEDLLSNGNKMANVVFEEAEGAGYKKATIQRAAKRLNIKRKKMGLDGGWEWSLPSNSSNSSKMFEHFEDCKDFI